MKKIPLLILAAAWANAAYAQPATVQPVTTQPVTQPAATQAETTAPKQAIVKPQVTRAPWVPGKQWFQTIDTAFKKGDYQTFISQINGQYNESQQSPEWAKAKEEEKKWQEDLKTDEGKNKLNEIKSCVEKYTAQLEEVEKETQQSLAKIAEKYPYAPVTKVIQEINGLPKLTESQDSALKYVAELDFPLSSPSENDLTQELKNLGMEYTMKKSLLFMASRDSKQQDFESLQEKMVVLDLERFRNMIDVSEKYKDSATTNKLKEAQQAYATSTIKRHDMSYLESFVSGQRLPGDPAENEVKDILSAAQAKKRELFLKQGCFQPQSKKALENKPAKSTEESVKVSP